MRAPKFVQAPADDAVTARNYSEALVWNRLGNRSVRAERSEVEGPSTPGLRPCARNDRNPKSRSKVRTNSGALQAAAGVFLLALSAGAQPIYRWMDAQGEEHFTDDPAGIPPEHRKAAQPVRGLESSKAPAPAPKPSAAAAPSAPRLPSAPSTNDTQRGEQEAREKRWRGAFREARERVATLVRALAADRAAVADPNAAGMPVRRLIGGAVLPSFEYEAARQRIARNEAELAKAREALEELDRSASREAVPREWRVE